MNGFGVFMIAFLTSVLTAAGTVYVIERTHLLEGRVEQTSVPDLHGLEEKDARTNLEAARLMLLVGGREPSATAKPGTVLRQSVLPGQKVPPDHPVSVIFAEAVPKAPSVLGLTLEEAKQKIEPQGYRIEAGATIPDDNVPVGKILSQTPPADTPHDKAKPIVVQLSLGGAAVDVPKVVGTSVKSATAELEKVGLKVAPMRWVSIAETATFVVLSQKPAAGEKVKPGTEVVLTANR